LKGFSRRKRDDVEAPASSVREGGVGTPCRIPRTGVDPAKQGVGREKLVAERKRGLFFWPSFLKG